MVELSVRRRYVNWLEGIVSHPSNSHRMNQYGGVVVLAFETDFVYSSSIPRDVDRAMDGLALRDKFEDATGLVIPTLGPCRMLEFLIALAMRMNDVEWDHNDPDRTSEFFWELLHNLKLDQWYNDRLLDEGDAQVLLIFENLNKRRYSPDGTDGGLFPLENPNADQRDIEIWYQMMEWFLQKK